MNTPQEKLPKFTITTQQDIIVIGVDIPLNASDIDKSHVEIEIHPRNCLTIITQDEKGNDKSFDISVGYMGRLHVNGHVCS